MAFSLSFPLDMQNFSHRASIKGPTELTEKREASMFLSNIGVLEESLKSAFFPF